MKNTLVIGVGNAFGSDDAVGLRVAQQIGERAIPGIAVVESSGDGGSLVEQYKRAEAVVLVDSVQSGQAAGTVHRFEVHRQPVPAALFDAHSSHAFGVAQSFELARVLGYLPSRCVVIGIEGRRYGPGTTMSPEVEAAAAVAENIVLEEIARTA